MDGLPLAIELAAARVRVLSVEQIADRLDDCFRLLTGGSRTALLRHQTLRAAIEWSHILLSEKERALFQRVAVFAGGFGLEAAEAVCAGRSIAASEILDVLSQLVDKSLVLVEDHDGARQPRGRARLRGDGARAAGLLRQSLALRRGLGDKSGIAECLAHLAGIAAAARQPERAARLLGAAEALRGSIGAQLPPAYRADCERAAAIARKRLGKRAFAEAWRRIRRKADRPLRVSASFPARSKEEARPRPNPQASCACPPDPRAVLRGLRRARAGMAVPRQEFQRARRALGHVNRA